MDYTLQAIMFTHLHVLLVLVALLVVRVYRLTTTAGVADRIQLAPLIFHEDVTIDEWGVEVTTNVASAQGKIVLYDSDSTNSLPGTSLW